jgi:ABC-2 type transport system permease protein
VIPTIPDLVASNPDIAEVIGASPDAEQALTDAFLRYIFVFMAVISTGFAVASVLRLRSEEESGRAEVALTTQVSRTSWMAATVVVAAAGAVVLSMLMGLGLAVGYALGAGEWDQVAAQVGGQLGYVPAVLVVAAVAVALVGVGPRWARVAWAVVAFVFLQVLLGETLRLPDWVSAISPFWHLSGVPVQSFDPVPAVAEVLLAAALVALGVWGFRRRDLTTG